PAVASGVRKQPQQEPFFPPAPVGPEVAPQARRQPEGPKSEVAPQARRQPEGPKSEVAPQARRQPEGPKSEGAPQARRQPEGRESKPEPCSGPRDRNREASVRPAGLSSAEPIAERTEAATSEVAEPVGSAEAPDSEAPPSTLRSPEDR